MKCDKAKQNKKKCGNEDTSLKDEVGINVALPDLHSISPSLDILPDHPPNQPKSHHSISDKINKKPSIMVTNTCPNPWTMIYI